MSIEGITKEMALAELANKDSKGKGCAVCKNPEKDESNKFFEGKNRKQRINT